MLENIVIKGASQHNLKNIDVTLPRNKFIVITGLSGSGKSSLAFDTLYAEGQRRYVESLSAYARQFLDRMQKPKVEHIEGAIILHLQNLGYTRLLLGGRHPLWGIGVTSLIIVTSRPAVCNALIAASRP